MRFDALRAMVYLQDTSGNFSNLFPTVFTIIKLASGPATVRIRSHNKQIVVTELYDVAAYDGASVAGVLEHSYAPA